MTEHDLDIHLKMHRARESSNKMKVELLKTVSFCVLYTYEHLEEQEEKNPQE